MAGKSSLRVTDEQRAALSMMANGSERGEADRARAVLLTLSGWTSGRIAEAFGVREETVRFRRRAFLAGGVEALASHPAPGAAPVKAKAALHVRFWLLPLRTARTGRWRAWPNSSRLPKRSSSAKGSRSRARNSPRCCGKRGLQLPAAASHAERAARKVRQDPDQVARVGLRPILRKQ
jgi:Helix-turn-helix domain